MNDHLWRILLVEDDPDDYVLTRAMFIETMGQSFILEWAKTFDSALASLDSDPYDVILVDYDLGARNGVEFLRETQGKGLQAPVILLTGRGNYEVDMEAMHAGAADYLSKASVTGPLLERTIRYAIERKQAELALLRVHDELEQRVRERTQELRLANGQLEASNTRLAEANEQLQAEIQGRIRVEALLRKSNEALQEQAYLLENVSDAIVASDETYTITTWNRAAEAIYGWQAEEAVGRQGPELLRTELIGQEPNQALQCLMETGSFSGELVHYRKDGQPIYIETKIIAIQDSAGKRSGYAAVNRDITERKQAEEKIRQYTARTEALAEISRALAEAGPDYSKVLETAVQRIAALIGDACVLAELSEDGQWLIPVAFHHPDPKAAAFLKEILASQPGRSDLGASGHVVQTNQPILIPDVDPEQVRSQVKPEYWPYLDRFGIHSLLIVPLQVQGRRIGTLGLSRDQPGNAYTTEEQAFLQNLADRVALAIENARLFEAGQRELSERQRVEGLLRESNAALRENEARFRTIFQESALGIALKDLDGRILAGNPALQEMLGYSDEELRRMRFDDLTHPADVAAEKVLFSRLSAGAIHRYRLEKRYLHKNGSTVWARLAVSLVQDEDGKPQFVIFLVENNTERKRIEAELEEVRRRLVESRETERLELAQDLHDGPMQELYAIAYQLTDTHDELSNPGAAPVGENSNSPAAEQLENTQEQIFKIIQELRSFCGELRPPTLTPFGLERTIQSHAETFQEQHPEIDLRLRLQPDGQLLPERVRLGLFRIYQHSLSNVIRHAQASQVDVRFYFDAEQVCLEIQDNGRGFIVPPWIELVREGHLGLAGAAERAEALGGQLELESAPGQGTSVRVEVPWVWEQGSGVGVDGVGVDGVGDNGVGDDAGEGEQRGRGAGERVGE